jgi:hypothetical protein
LSNRILAVIIVLVVVFSSLLGIWYYETYVPGTLYLQVFRSGPWVPDPDCSTCAWGADPTILQIYVNFSRIDLHSAGDSSQTGWRNVMGSTGLTRLDYSTSRWSARMLPGIFDSVRLNVSSVWINIQNVGNVSYSMAGGGFVPPFDRGVELRVQPGQYPHMWVSLTFLSSEIKARNGPLHVSAYAVPVFGNGAYP